MTLKVQMQKIADVPSLRYEHKGDSGVDLFAAQSFALQPMERTLVPTGLKIAIPSGYEGQVRPKSGLATNHGIGFVNAIGTIDSGYRGEIKIPVINFSDTIYRIEKGKKIGQLVFAKVEEATFEEVTKLENNTTRGEEGFGSTGLKR